ncbi:MAG: hypothetical protein HY818_18085 [Acetobacterium woodii]|nr:hypothetical protein [Acetobacterium woodii]
MWQISKDYFGYYTKVKVGSQEIIVNASYDPDEDHRFYIDACVYSKRKKIDDDICNKNITGKSGLRPLLVIRKEIIELEKFIADKHNGDFEILIYWTDNRRRDAYIFGLKDYGYEIGRRNNKKCLIKKICSTAP